MSTVQRSTTTPNRNFMLTVASTKMPIRITQMALDDFEAQGLAAMDDYLMRMTERLTPANAPELRPNPLDLVGQMMVDGMANGNTRKIMVCTLWLGHHYPCVTGLISNGQTFGFTQTNETQRRAATTSKSDHI
ncbi:MAG: hypothetical protein JKY27_00600 [Magnetovibrio sp.]|nr:hypothetical protein [Magnetovibrio sp.]